MAASKPDQGHMITVKQTENVHVNHLIPMVHFDSIYF